MIAASTSRFVCLAVCAVAVAVRSTASPPPNPRTAAGLNVPVTLILRASTSATPASCSFRLPGSFGLPGGAFSVAASARLRHAYAVPIPPVGGPSSCRTRTRVKLTWP